MFTDMKLSFLMVELVDITSICSYYLINMIIKIEELKYQLYKHDIMIQDNASGC